MVYTILISIVFIAELIITITVLKLIHNLDKSILEFEEKLNELKPQVKDVSELVTKISKQYTEISNQFVENLKINQEEFALKQLSKILMAILLVKFNKGAIKRFHTSKLGKTLSRGLSLLEIMV